MGDVLQPMLLADTVSRIESFVDVFLGVYILLILAYIILSWIRLPYSVWLNRIQRFLYDVCDPYLRVFRRFVPPIGPLDLRPNWDRPKESNGGNARHPANPVAAWQCLFGRNEQRESHNPVEVHHTAEEQQCH